MLTRASLMTSRFARMPKAFAHFEWNASERDDLRPGDTRGKIIYLRSRLRSSVVSASVPRSPQLPRSPLWCLAVAWAPHLTGAAALAFCSSSSRNLSLGRPA